MPGLLLHAQKDLLLAMFFYVKLQNKVLSKRLHRNKKMYMYSMRLFCYKVGFYKLSAQFAHCTLTAYSIAVLYIRIRNRRNSALFRVLIYCTVCTVQYIMVLKEDFLLLARMTNLDTSNLLLK